MPRIEPGPALPAAVRMLHGWALAALLVALALLAGCAQLARKSIVDVPPAVTIPAPPPPVANGAILQAGYVTRPLFEDQRPRMPGDVLTIVFNEQVSATKNANANAARDGSLKFSPDVVPGGLRSTVGKLGTDISGSHDFQGTGGAAANNTFTGTMTVTVVSVEPNGNLRVHGEKQIGINQGTEFIRFAGTVDPRNIGPDNSIQSSRVADARIEYVGDGYINDAQHPGWLQRAMWKIWPF